MSYWKKLVEWEKPRAERVHVTEAFMTAASPGVIAFFLESHYYPTHETYLYVLSDAMKEEYDAISVSSRNWIVLI